MSKIEANGIERDFLQEVRKARPEDCKAVIFAMNFIDGKADIENGELTPLGILVSAIVEELTLNGVLKRTFDGGGVKSERMANEHEREHEKVCNE